MRIFQLLLISVLIFIIIHCTANKTDLFKEFEIAVNDLEKQEKWQDAIELTDKMWDKLPEYRYELIREYEYLYRKTNQLEKGLEILSFGHEQGYFYLINPNAGNFKPYKDYAIFDSLVIRDRVLRAKALETSRMIYEVVPPVNHKQDDTLPVMIILHGGGSTLEKARDRWELPEHIQNEYILVYIQSHLLYDSKNYGWRTGDERIYKDLRDNWKEIINEFNIDTTRVFVGGMSAGGSMAFDIAFNYILPVKGVIGICSGKPRGLVPEMVSEAFDKDLRVYMLGGEKDFYLSRQKDMAEMFQKSGLKFKHIVIDGLGHEIPEDIADRVNDAVNFINN